MPGDNPLLNIRFSIMKYNIKHLELLKVTFHKQNALLMNYNIKHLQLSKVTVHIIASKGDWFCF
jgi:hypothetical protein